MPKIPSPSAHSKEQLEPLPSGKTGRSTSRQPRARFSPEYEVLLAKLIAARKAAGVTQEVMAQALGKTQSHVSMCEKREREVSVIDFWKWCLALGINWSDFVRELEAEILPVIDSKDSK